MSVQEVDLFGTPILNQNSGPKLDPQIVEQLLEQRITVLGPTHKRKVKEGGIIKNLPGPNEMWLPPRGSYRQKVMIVGYHPADQEIKQRALLVGPTGIKLEQTLVRCTGISLEDCYLTNLVKYYFPAQTLVPQEAVDICRPYLQYEIEKLKPEIIICLGSEVFSHLTGYEGGINDYRGSLLDHPDFPYSKISVVWLPSVVLKNPELEEIWINDLKSIFNKHNVQARTNWEIQDSLPVLSISNIAELRQAVDEELAKGNTTYAIDTEFDGEVWTEAHLFKVMWASQDRTFDIHLMEPKQGYAPRMFPATKGKHKHSVDPTIADHRLFDTEEELQMFLKEHRLRTRPLAAYVREYQWIFNGTKEEVAAELRRLFCRPGNKIWGHMGRSDYKLLLKLGVNLYPYVELDTATLALHLDENQPLGLEDLAKKYLGAPNHKLPLIHWLRTHPVHGGQLPYGFVPRSIIDRYAQTDARRTYDLRAELLTALDKLEEQCVKRGDPSIKKAYFEHKMGQFLALAEMEIIGQPVDLNAMATSIEWYENQKKEQLRRCVAKVCAVTGWKSFNPFSPPQVANLLFNHLKLTPLYSTDKPPIPWEKVAAMPPEEQAKITPSTNQETLETLAIDDPICAEVNNTRILGTLSKNYLRKGARWSKKEKPAQEINLLEMMQEQLKQPEEVDPVEDLVEEEDFWGDIAKDKSSRALSQVVSPTGYLYTTYFELLETHRLATKPNISAIPKGESKYIKDIVGSAPPFEIRNLFKAPKEWVIAEADWVTGEVWLLMTLAQDTHGLAILNDPTRDVHSAMAKKMFPNLIPADMPEIEVKSKFKQQRDAAKPVTFGVPYQRGPEAIARQLNREAANNKLNVRYTKEDGAAFISAYAENFPQAWKYLETQMARVVKPRYQVSPWGFRRNYPYITDTKLLAKMQREASNWQIQHGIACTMMSACKVWSTIRKDYQDLPIFLIDILHDATKWLIHKSALDVAPQIISTVMGSGIAFPFPTPSPLRHEVTFYEQWGGKPIEDRVIATMCGATRPTKEDMTRDIPTWPYFQSFLNAP
jgi:DNA polymerase